MNSIPLYDDTVPIACSADRDELALRLDQIERLRSRLTRLERVPDGIVLHFPNDPAVAAELASFTVDEKACCAFWGFAISSTEDELALRWEGPPTVSDLFDDLVRFFVSGEPLTAFAGLL